MPSEPDAGVGGAEQGCDPNHVYNGSLSVTSQDNLEDLRGVTAFDGTLYISGDVSDLSPLACLRTITGQLLINDTTGLSSLDGLGSLSFIGLQLAVGRNSSLLSLSGLRSLQEVGRGILITENPSLESVAGVGVNAPEWRVVDNDSLESLSGFETVGEGVLWIASNGRLATLGALRNLRRGQLSLVDNDSLESLSGLENVEEGALWIEHNERLATLGGLRNLRRGQLRLIDNDALTSLAGLGAVESLEERFIFENDGLVSLKGLERLTTVQKLTLWENRQLSSLRGVDGLVSAGYIDISLNDGRRRDPDSDARRQRITRRHRRSARPGPREPDRNLPPQKNLWVSHSGSGRFPSVG